MLVFVYFEDHDEFHTCVKIANEFNMSKRRIKCKSVDLDIITSIHELQHEQASTKCQHRNAVDFCLFRLFCHLHNNFLSINNNCLFSEQTTENGKANK